MKSRTRRLLTATAMTATFGVLSVGPASAHATCADVSFLGIDVHGHHVVRDYVVGTDFGAWPPQGIGSLFAEGGAAIPGGPGPGFHFPRSIAPGASFCTASNSPGWHAGE